MNRICKPHVIMDVGEEALIEKTPEEKNESDEDTGNENKKVNDDLIDLTEKEISAKKVQNAEKETNYDFKSLVGVDGFIFYE